MMIFSKPTFIYHHLKERAPYKVTFHKRKLYKSTIMSSLCAYTFTELFIFKLYFLNIIRFLNGLNFTFTEIQGLTVQHHP